MLLKCLHARMHLLYMSVWLHLQEGRQSLVVPACLASPVSPTQDTQWFEFGAVHTPSFPLYKTSNRSSFTEYTVQKHLWCATSMAFLFLLISCLSLLYLNGRPKSLPFTLTPLGAWWQGSWGHNFQCKIKRITHCLPCLLVIQSDLENPVTPRQEQSMCHI